MATSESISGAGCYLTDLSRTSSATCRCLSVLSAPSPGRGSVSDTVKFACTAVTLHIYVRRYYPANRTFDFSDSPLYTCKCLHGHLKKALRLCYENRLRQEHRPIVTVLIGEIFLCEHDLGFLFHFLGKSPVPYLDDDVMYPESRTSKHRALYALEFYLNCIDMEQFTSEGHTNNPNKVDLAGPSGLLNSSRFFIKSDPPLILAAASANAGALLLLLRYGANPLTRFARQSFDGRLEKTRDSALSMVVSSLNCLAFAKRRCHTAHSEDVLRREEEKLMLCLRFMCRAVPDLPLISSGAPDAPTQWHSREGPGARLLVREEVFTCLTERGLVGVASLRHLCRCAIRERLREVNRGLLPRLIGHLPLPGRLKSYINLYHD